MKVREQIKMMGLKVLVTKELCRRKSGGTVSWEARAIEPTFGWVVGFRNLYNGVHKPGWGYHEEYSPGYLEVTHTTQAALVCTWPGKVPIRVPPEALKQAPEGTGPKSPYKWPEGSFQTTRNFLRDQAKETKRDNRGRFLKQ